MTTFPKTSLLVVAIFGVAGIARLTLAQSQPPRASGTPEITPEIPALLKAVEQLPTIPADAVPLGPATFYSAQFPFWPPLPANFYGVPVWDLQDGWFLLDDLQINYSQIAADAASTAATMTLSASVTPMGGGISPDGLTQAPYLTITQTGTNQVLITVTNAVTYLSYSLFNQNLLTGPAWTVVTNAPLGVTNFIVGTGPYYQGYYQVLGTTNANFLDTADPNNPNLGFLSITIISPAQGQIIQ